MLFAVSLGKRFLDLRFEILSAVTVVQLRFSGSIRNAFGWSLVHITSYND
jgi:hypothetical protein